MDYEEEIFGGELSELDSSDEEVLEERAVSPGVKGPSPSPSPEAEGEAEDEPEEEEEGGDEEYQGEGSLLRLPSFKKKGRSGDGSEARKKKEKKRKRTRSEEPVEQDEGPDAGLTESELARKRLDEKLNAILKGPKKKSKKKRRLDEEDLGVERDEEEILQLRQDMMGAFRNDYESNVQGRPAFEKLVMLSRVTETLQKSHLETVALDQGILTAIKEWLEPLPDKSLPTITIQRALFSILLGMKSIDATYLKESDLGKIVMFYQKCSRVEPSIRRAADELMVNWLRPLLGRSSTWRDRPVQTASIDTESATRTKTLASQQQQNNTPDTDFERRHARVPLPVSSTYKVAPRGNAGTSGAGGHGGGERRSNVARFREFNTKLKAMKTKD